MKAKERGVSCLGCLVATVIVVALALGGLRIIKAYMQNAEITHVLQAMAEDAELQSASENDIRIAFARRASVAEISAIQPDDVQVSRSSGVISLSAEYSVSIPVAGNISMVLNFNPHSAQR